jgi:hypothetical protein
MNIDGGSRQHLIPVIPNRRTMPLRDRSTTKVILVFYLVVLAVLMLAASPLIVRYIRYSFETMEANTLFAPGFTEEKFRQVKLGMTQEEVIALLGEPVKAEAHYDPYVKLWYAIGKPLNRKQFKCYLRMVRIGPDGRVNHIMSSDVDPGLVDSDY